MKVLSKNVYEGPMNMDNSEGTDYGSGGRRGGGEKGGNNGTTFNSINSTIFKKQNKRTHLLDN